MDHMTIASLQTPSGGSWQLVYTPGIWYYMYIVYIHVPGIWWCPRGAGMGKVCVSHSVCLAAALLAGAMATRGGGVVGKVKTLL